MKENKDEPRTRHNPGREAVISLGVGHFCYNCIMDFLSHGLWSAVAYKAARRKTARPLNVWLAVFFGVLPDVFAFAIPFTLLFIRLISGQMSLADWPRPNHDGVVEPPQNDALNIFPFTNQLYNISHSLIVFLIIFGLVALVFRRPVWEMLAWFLHILMDIPTHTYRFYPTPFLWPLSGWKFEGVAWATPWFLILNYGALIFVFLWLWLWRRSAVKSPS